MFRPWKLRPKPKKRVMTKITLTATATHLMARRRLFTASARRRMASALLSRPRGLLSLRYFFSLCARGDHLYPHSRPTLPRGQ